MKKLIVMISISLVILVSLLLLFLKPRNKFNVEKNAEFYLVRSNGVTAYRLSGEKLSELSSSSFPLVDDTVNHMVQKVSLGNRYLMFSDEDSPTGLNSKVISIDFQTGLVRRKKSQKTAYTSSGRSNRYYYTSEATTANMRLTAFDSELNEKFSYNFDESIVGSDFWVSGEKIYLIGAKSYQGDYENFLFVFQEFDDHIELIEEEPLYYSNDYRYAFGDSYLINSKLFSPVTGHRNRETKEKWSGQLILELDLESGEKVFHELAYPAPYQSFLLDHQYIAFSHEYGTNGKLLISLFDINSKQVTSIDFEGRDLSFEETFVQDVKRYDDSIILILLANHLLVYNTTEQRVVLSERVGDVNQPAVALWVNRSNI